MDKDEKWAKLLAQDQSELSQKYDELKRDRSYIRRLINKQVCEEIVLSAKSGYLPSFETIMLSIMNKVSLLMDEHPDASPLFWSIILQDKEPDASCQKTVKFLGITFDAPPEPEPEPEPKPGDE